VRLNISTLGLPWVFVIACGPAADDAMTSPDARVPDRADIGADPPDADARPTEGPLCTATPCQPEPGFDDCLDRLVFVAAGAALGGDGSRQRPFTEIGRAVAHAAGNGGGSVVVAGGVYKETVNLPDGVCIHGGYGPDWIRRDAVTEIRGIDPEGRTCAAVIADDVLRGAGLDRVTLTTVDGAAGTTTIGLLARRAPALVLHAVVARPGHGGAGRAGLDGRPGAAGGRGSDGEHVQIDYCFEAVPGDGGRNPSCPIANGGRGTFDGRPPGDPAARCQDPPCPEVLGRSGASGADGDATLGTVHEKAGWLGAPGTAGRDGQHGVGNAGVRGDHPGGGRGPWERGGGGGAGGCGGAAGSGGDAGGGSFGLVAVDSAGLLLRECDLAGGAGGRGGEGGRGGAGGRGGLDGRSLLCEPEDDLPDWHDCVGELVCEVLEGGGQARDGGDGGNGGRGADGVSAGVLCVGGAVEFGADNTLAAGIGADAASTFGCCGPGEQHAADCLADSGL